MLTLSRLSILLTCSLSVYASLVSEIVDAIEQAVDCDSCHALLGVLTGVAILGDTVFDDTMVAVCQVTGAADDDVCKGLIDEQGPIIAHDLRSISPFGQTATKLCNALIGLCQAPAVNTLTFPIPKAAPSNPTAFTSTGQTPFQVVHFSDVHIDRSYTPGSDANCTKPICCRNYADHTGPIIAPAGPLGHLSCDTPTPLVHSMLGAVSAQDTRFSIFTGDVVEAAIWLVNQTENTSNLELFNNEMSTLLNATVYPAIGNHEVAPINAFPRNTTSIGSAQWVFDTQSTGWTSLIGDTAALEVKHNSGSYSAVVDGTNLMIISINSIYWYRDNFYLFDSDTLQPDPNGVIAFTAQQLQAAEDAGMRAWIIGHMSPGSGDALHDQASISAFTSSNYFDQVIQRYKNTIAAQFFGHSHVDEFEIAYSDYKNQTAEAADSIAYLAPSLTPRQGNPSFRVYDVDPDTYEVMDSRTFMSDMTDPTFQDSPVWTQEYSARETYGPAIGGWPATEPLNAAFWHRVTEAFAANNTLFQIYNSLKTRGIDVPVCTGSCQTTTICNLRAMRAENNCEVATPGFNFRREEDEGAIHAARRGTADHCEGLGVRSIFENAARNTKNMDAQLIRKRVDEAEASLLTRSN